jgi:hypothetical protein
MADSVKASIYIHDPAQPDETREIKGTLTRDGNRQTFVADEAGNDLLIFPIKWSETE